MNIEHIEDMSKGTCPTIVDTPEMTFIVATAWGSCELPGSCLHLSSSPTNRFGHVMIPSNLRIN